MQNQQVLFGVENFVLQADKFKTIRFALVTNNAATTNDGTLSRLALAKADIKLIKLFSPEHGITAAGEDGVFQNNSIDPITNLPVISLYGDHLNPTEEDLKETDAVLFDIPDAGCRFYTYLWTMTYVMEACAECGKPLFILDRPNPIGGNIELVEGPMLDEKNCSSFIGRWPIPVRHSCTLGELASYFKATRTRNINLNIIKVQNWKRNQSVKEAGWFFTPTSPAIRDEETALLYPGTGLLEGINVNEGRGTDFPFKIVGAPWINASQFQKAFEELQLPGINVQPYSYTPSFGLYANEICHGIKFAVTDRFKFRPVHTGLQLIHLIQSLYPDLCTERLYRTRANPTGEKHLDKLTGVADSFNKIKRGELFLLSETSQNWKETIRPYLLYK